MESNYSQDQLKEAVRLMDEFSATECPWKITGECEFRDCHWITDCLNRRAGLAFEWATGEFSSPIPKE